MSDVSGVITKYANDLAASAAKIRSEHDFSLVKSAAVTALVDGGLEQAVAEEVLDGLKSTVAPDSVKMLEKAAELEGEVKFLEKVATYIEDLEAKLASAEQKLSDLEKAAQVGDELKSLSESQVFSNEELEQLKSLPASTLQKVAHSVDTTPWSLGQRSDRVDSTVDPILHFVMN